jgi:hypothetical protein
VKAYEEAHFKDNLRGNSRASTPELALHAARDFFYGVLFYTLSGSVSCAPSPASRLNPQIKFVKPTIVF